MKVGRSVRWAIAPLVVAFLPAIPGELKAPRPPEQPKSGPGGAEYRHAEVVKQRYGSGAGEYWLYEPSNPKPVSAPVLLFIHGWGAVNPRAYGAWIEHLVRRGSIVVWTRYQVGFRSPPDEVASSVIDALKAALKELQGGPGHVKPDFDRFAIVGHSAGGQTAANVAALARQSGLPETKAVMCVQPGKSWNRLDRLNIHLEDLSKIAKGTLLLAVAGDHDSIVRDVDAKRIFKESTQIPAENKDLVILASDDHGSPALVADHFAPCAVDEDYDSTATGQVQPDGGGRLALFDRIRDPLGESAPEPEGQESEARETLGVPDLSKVPKLAINALEYYGLWKLFDGLCDAAFYGKNRQYALGNTKEQRYMGTWSDGVAVRELTVVDRP